MPPRPLFGVVTSVLRMAFGGHFFTDVAAAGLVTFLVIWLAYGYIYRWPPTRLTDEEHRRRADAAGMARLSAAAALARPRRRPAVHRPEAFALAQAVCAYSPANIRCPPNSTGFS